MMTKFHFYKFFVFVLETVCVWCGAWTEAGAVGREEGLAMEKPQEWN